MISRGSEFGKIGSAWSLRGHLHSEPRGIQPLPAAGLSGAGPPPWPPVPKRRCPGESDGNQGNVTLALTVS